MSPCAPAKLIVLRKKQQADSWRDYRIFVDGKEAFRVPPGGQHEMTIRPGRHTLEARLDWGSSPPLTITAKSGEEVFVGVENPWTITADLAGGWRALYAATFARKAYLSMSRLVEVTEDNVGV